MYYVVDTNHSFPACFESLDEALDYALLNNGALVPESQIDPELRGESA